MTRSLPYVCAGQAGDAELVARRLAQSLHLPFADNPPEAGLCLIHAGTHLELRDCASSANVRVEFRAEVLRRYRSGRGRNPLQRAVGPGPRHVVDATAGLGGDTVHLVALGHRVTAIEHNPIVSALVLDGIERARAQGVLGDDNPRWYTGDACLLLHEVDPPADTVYLDPMFPPRRKKSPAVRKEMQLLRQLLADAHDPIELLAAARASAAERVVVKRPLAAAPLAPRPSASYCGKLIRYDVYRARVS